MSGNVTKAVGSLDKLSRQSGLAGWAVKGMAMSMGAMLNPAMLVAGGIGKVVDVMGDSISAASDQAEALSKVTVVFGDQADEIEAWANTASRSMGLSKTAALDAAGTLGNLFDGLGIADQAAADMSKSITQLAADLGSFNNVATDDALLALRSGLLGEAEPMRKFGSALNAVRVEAKASAMGLTEWINVNGKLKPYISESAKVQARYALILEDTKNAQGDFARTADGLANSQKSLDAAMADLSATLGNLLIGPAKGFITFLDNIVSRLAGQGGSTIPENIRLLADEMRGLDGAASHTAVTGVKLFTLSLEDAQKQIDNLVVAGRANGSGAGEMVAKLGPQFLVLASNVGVTADRLFFLASAAEEGGHGMEVFRSSAFAAVTGSKSAVTSMVDAWTLGMGTVETVTEETLKATAQNVRGIAWNIPMGIVGAVKDGIPDVKSVMKDLRWAIEHPMALTKDRAKILGALTGDKLVQGINSKNPLIRQAAIDARAALLTQWNALPAKAMELGELTIRQLVHGLSTGESYALGLYGQTGTTSGDAQVRRNRRRHRAGGGPVSAGVAYMVGEYEPEMFVPSTNGTILNGQQMAAAGGGVHFHFHGLAVAPSEAQMQQYARTVAPALRRELARTGA